MKDQNDLVFLFLIGILIFVSGFVIVQIFTLLPQIDSIQERKIDGIFIADVSYEQAKGVAQQKDSLGDWVCVNIKGMDYKRAIEVCSHETGHEIFAEICEKDAQKCFDVVEVLR